jgi:hypothetical protein
MTRTSTHSRSENPGPANGLGFWTPERVEQLRALHYEGLSASKIAGRLGHGCTRNMVIGKLDRLRGRGDKDRIKRGLDVKPYRDPLLARP